ncbi:hypothetical protein BGZ98_005149 [Dissophora globulifera]|nr:hypothetical protein BGZ98_005149 [Dissophora globulifera]
MSSILNAFRSAQTPTRQFTSLNIASVSTAKGSFHPEVHPIVLQQLVESVTPRVNATVAAAAKESLSSSPGKIQTPSAATRAKA